MLKTIPVSFLKVACLLALFSLLPFKIIGQPDLIKFGKIELPELQMKAYDKDTSAEAVVLCEYGQSYFKYIGNDVKLFFEHHVRIKILKKSGYSWADINIPFYRISNSSEENVLNLKGYTYNLVNGEIVKEKLAKESVFEEHKNEFWYQKKFTMPNVKEGSVIEFAYTIQSDFFFNLREWKFQRTIPVKWSEYRVEMPEYFDYKQLFSGYEPLHIANKKEINSSFLGGTATVKATAYQWIGKDVPAFREEPYLTTIDDFINKIEFEFANINLPGHYSPNTYNWENLTKQLLEDESLGKQLGKTGFLKDQVAAIKAKYTEPKLQMLAAYEFVRNQMKWNELNQKYITTTLKKAYENKTGNSADINLILVAMLQELGLDANPVILSTRDNGRTLDHVRMLSKFNYVIAHVNLEGKDVLLDATDPLLKYNMLPTRCLNGQGRLISAQNPRWIPLETAEKRSRLFNARLTVQADGEVKGIVEISNSGYSALDTRKEIRKEGKDKYAEVVKKENPHWQIVKFDLSNVDKLEDALNSKYEVTINEQVQTAGDRIYFKPLLTEIEDENPFKLENRKYPVDFATLAEYTFVANYTLPAGYQVEEAPKNIVIDLPEKGGRFSYMVSASGNTLMVTSKISIRKAVFYAEEYPYLKEFFNHIVTKHAEQVVLKKTGN
jgi:transglutaminase-like putative cysteine protease